MLDFRRLESIEEHACRIGERAADDAKDRADGAAGRVDGVGNRRRDVRSSDFVAAAGADEDSSDDDRQNSAHERPLVRAVAGSIPETKRRARRSPGAGCRSPGRWSCITATAAALDK